VVNIKVEQSLSLEQFFLNLSFQKRVILHEWVSRMNQGSDLFPVRLQKRKAFKGVLLYFSINDLLTFSGNLLSRYLALL
jgi:hypothetical protein